MSSTYINRSDPTAHDTILGIGTNKRGPNIVSFGVKVVLFFSCLSPLVINNISSSVTKAWCLDIRICSLIESMHFVREMA